MQAISILMMAQNIFSMNLTFTHFWKSVRSQTRKHFSYFYFPVQEHMNSRVQHIQRSCRTLGCACSFSLLVVLLKRALQRKNNTVLDNMATLFLLYKYKKTPLSYWSDNFSHWKPNTKPLAMKLDKFERGSTCVYQKLLWKPHISIKFLEMESGGHFVLQCTCATKTMT